jgi:hypothetical protein
MNFRGQHWSCHAERSEASVLRDREMLRCAQHDMTGFECENPSSHSAEGCYPSWGVIHYGHTQIPPESNEREGLLLAIIG